MDAKHTYKIIPDRSTAAIRGASIPLCLACCLILSSCTAQTFSEWFRQKKTELKYYAQQIAALQVYATDIEKGYSIAEQGLNGIGSITQTEFGLHQNYFQSLVIVNPHVRQYSRIGTVLANAQQITALFTKTLTTARSSQSFTAAEIGYFEQVETHLSQVIGNSLDRLKTLTTDGECSMKDDERIAGIDAIDRDTQDRYTFARSFTAQILALINQGTAERNDSRSLQNLFIH